MNRKAIETIFRKHYKSLFIYACRFINRRDTAEDILQDIFYNILKSGKNLDPDDGAKGYLFTATRNQCLNYIKHEKVKDRFEEQEGMTVDQITNRFLHELAAREPGLFRDDLGSQLKDAIRKLPDQCRRIFILSRKYGLKNREIAEYLNISVKVVEKQVSKALVSLREQLLLRFRQA